MGVFETLYRVEDQERWGKHKTPSQLHTARNIVAAKINQLMETSFGNFTQMVCFWHNVVLDY